MANILGLITVDDAEILSVDAVPSAAAGTPATIGSLAQYNSGSAGTVYIKTGAADTAWDLITTAASGGVINSGTASRLALYPVTGNTLADTYVQNSQNIDVHVAAQPTRTAAIEYTIPNPGDAITAASFVLTQGDQIINGEKTFANDVLISGNLSVSGTMTYVNSTTTDIANKAITLNLGGAASSGSAVGFNVSEGAVAATVTLSTGTNTAVINAVPAGVAGNSKSLTVTNSGSGGFRLVSDLNGAVIVDLGGVASVSAATFNALGAIGITMASGVITGTEVLRTLSGGTEGIVGSFLTSAARSGFTFLAPTSAFSETLRLSNLSAARTLDVPDASGAIVIQAATPAGVANQLPFWSNTTTLTNPTGTSTNSLYWDSTNFRLAIGNVAPTVALDVTGSARVRGLSIAGIVHNDATGLLSTSLVSLTADVSGILPIANGGTNSSAALNNNRIMVSSGGAIVEASALTNGQLLIGSTGAAPVAASITGTANQVVVTPGAGSITLSTPQNIHTGATPTFAGETLSGAGAYLDINDTTAATDMKISMATVNTTDATITTIATVATASNTVTLLKVEVTGIRTGGTAGTAGDSCAYIRTVRVKNNAGTATLVNLQTDYTSEDQVAFDSTISISGTNALVTVRGASNNNMTWKAVITRIV